MWGSTRAWYAVCGLTNDENASCCSTRHDDTWTLTRDGTRDRPPSIPRRLPNHKPPATQTLSPLHLYSHSSQVTPIKAGKVVAGLEPENTNKWLQQLAAGASSVDAGKSADCVARAIAGEEPGSAGEDAKGGDDKPTAAPAAEDKGGRAEGKDADADEPEPAPAKDDAGKPPASRGGGRQVGMARAASVP